MNAEKCNNEDVLCFEKWSPNYFMDYLSQKIRINLKIVDIWS